MKVFLLGKNGMLGKQLWKHFQQLNIKVYAPDKKTCDITSDRLLESFKTPVDYIVNASGYTQVDLAESQIKQAYAINDRGVENLSLLANKLGAKLIHFSTDYVFDGKQKQLYDEEAICSPLNMYGLSKREGEKKVMALCQDYIIIRLSWLIGVYGSNFVNTMVHLMQSKESLKVVNDQWGRPTFCHDVASLFPDIFQLSGLYHFANDGICSWYILAEAIYQSLLPSCTLKNLEPILSKDYPQVAKRPFHAVLDSRKIQSQLNIKPRSWQQALQHYFNQRENLCQESITVSS